MAGLRWPNRRLNEPKGRVAFRFDARDVHLVMGTASDGSVPFSVSIDGAPPGSAAGGDIDASGSGELSEPRMYQLIRQQGPIADRLFEIEFLDGAPRFTHSHSAEQHHTESAVERITSSQGPSPTFLGASRIQATSGAITSRASSLTPLSVFEA